MSVEEPAPRSRLVLVRHGESVATADRYIGGHRTCRGLTEHGTHQAEALRDRWMKHLDISPDVIVSSHFPRAIETAEIIAPALGDLHIHIEPGVGEHDPGPICDGMTYDAYVKRYGPGLDWDDPFHNVFEDGETMSAFHHRAASALYALASTYAGKTVVVFCHGGVVDVAFRSLLRLPIAGGFALHTLNTSISSFERVNPTKWVLERYNDAAHLADLS